VGAIPSGYFSKKSFQSISALIRSPLTHFFQYGLSWHLCKQQIYLYLSILQTRSSVLQHLTEHLFLYCRQIKISSHYISNRESSN